ncbi:MAG TPA: hypothetical protein VGZ90_17635 [Puia sp.]|nr:hypothetical protein [Puia sp.]
MDKKLPVIGAFFMALVFLHAPGFAQMKDTGITIRQSAHFQSAAGTGIWYPAQFSGLQECDDEVFSIN